MQKENPPRGHAPHVPGTILHASREAPDLTISLREVKDEAHQANSQAGVHLNNNNNMPKPEKSAVKSDVDDVLIKASKLKQKPTKPLPDEATLSGDLKIGPQRKAALSSDYNDIIDKYNGQGKRIGPGTAGGFVTVGETVDEVYDRI